MGWGYGGWDSERTVPPGTSIFKGFINVAGDFPSLDSRSVGDEYFTNNEVTDPYPPGQTVPANNIIKWMGSAWAVTDTESIWKDDTSIISKINSTRDVDVSNGSLIADVIEAKDATGLGIYDDGSNIGVFIKDGGNVGIGTNNPLDKLQVNGDLRISEETTDSKIILQDADSGSFPNLKAFSKTGAFGVTFSIDAIPGESTRNSLIQVNRSTNTTGLVRVQFNKGNGEITDVNCQIGGNIDSWFNYLTGNVGIGNNAPGEKLHVTGNVKQNGLLTVSDSLLFADEYVVNFPAEFGNGEACFGTVFVKGAAGGIANFRRTSDNTIVIDYATPGIFRTDGFDGYVNILNLTNVLSIYNRLGAGQYIAYTINK